VIQEQLAKRLKMSLHVSNSIAGGDDAQPVKSPNGEAAVDVDEDTASSDDGEYNPTLEYLLPPPPQRNKKKATTKDSNPKLVLNRNFMCFLQPGTFNNQPFQKGQPPIDSISEMDCFDANYQKQLHFNFSEMQNTRKQTTEATRVSRLRKIDLDTSPEPSVSGVPSSKQHELSWYVLEDILDFPVQSCFIVCIALDGLDLERGGYYAEKSKIIASELKRAGLDAEWWRMSGKKYLISQGKIDQSLHYSDIKMKTLSKHQFIDSFFRESGDIAIQFDGISTWLTIPWHDIIYASRSIMLFGHPLT
jgi:hypothetical protein